MFRILRFRAAALAICAEGDRAPSIVRPGHRWSREEVVDWLTGKMPTETLVGLDISGSLAFDAATRSVLLTEPRVEKLDFARVPPLLREPVSRLGVALGKELLDRYPLATLEPGQLTWHGQEYRVLGFDIVEEGLKVILRRQP